MGHSWVFGYILSYKLLFYLDSLIDVCTLAANVQHFSCFVECLIQQHFSDPLKSSPIVSFESCQSTCMNLRLFFLRSTYHRTRSMDVLSTSGSFINIHNVH